MRLAALLTGTLLTVSLAAAAQAPGTPEADLKAGRELFAAKNFDNAARRFEAVSRSAPNHAEAQLLLGQCYTELGRYAEARTALAKATELDAGLKPRATEYLALIDTREKGADGARSKAEAEAAAVRARAAAALRARAEAEAAARNTAFSAPVAAAPLVYGVYTCSFDNWDAASQRFTSVPKGAFELNANGTYRYLDGSASGRYTYNAQTRQLIWITGYFAEAGKPKTTFAPGEKVSQLNIEFSTDKGPQRWSCGCNSK
ncbi:tetratricopeptide repeat protein [Hymenobacter latericus]|uniref:tetratricopeptide repeat protein n=1 Tax=Hymenobacter sp. YIM 151858-1 TaxID=2987688 RepID=UPI002226003B|nr:tetratricopeptide repeat protein [Hymenobacter sp. YIM 151858-1]UYZ60377.1 tetratricopeptide repeat protein [Hymenobacter sp. YIM 151858-1]